MSQQFWSRLPAATGHWFSMLSGFCRVEGRPCYIQQRLGQQYLPSPRSWLIKLRHCDCSRERTSDTTTIVVGRPNAPGQPTVVDRSSPTTNAFLGNSDLTVCCEGNWWNHDRSSPSNTGWEGYIRRLRASIKDRLVKNYMHRGTNSTLTCKQPTNH